MEKHTHAHAPTRECRLCNLWQDIKDGMSGCSRPPIAVKPLCFSLALPSVPSSSPNPFKLVVLSNFTQSSRSSSRKKEESGPQVRQTIPFSCLPPLPATTDRQLYGQHWPKTMRGIFSTVIWRAHGTHTHTHMQNNVLSKYTDSRGKIRRYNKTGQETLKAAKARVLTSTKHLLPSGSGQ